MVPSVVAQVLRAGRFFSSGLSQTGLSSDAVCHHLKLAYTGAVKLQPELGSGPEIKRWADRYCAGDINEELALISLSSPQLAAQGLSLEHLMRLGRWKSVRSTSYVRRNTDEYVREITRFALSTPSERARIEALTLLDGVGWPTASVVLHLYHGERYPILDVRALWSVGADLTRAYDFAFWRDYVQFCREQASRAGVDMRTLDRALWQCSKEKQ